MFTIRLCFHLVILAGLGASPWVMADAIKEPAKPELSEEEKPFLELANQARAKAKLPPLTINAQLLRAARDHASNMAKKCEMNHVLDGKDPPQRVKSQSYEYEKVAENIASCEKRPAAEVFKNWMETQHNKENIMNEEFKEVGIGVAKNDKGETYYTLVFGVARSKR
jgi:uncharacterized protein YkwD